MNYDQLKEDARIIDEYFAINDNHTVYDHMNAVVFKYSDDRTKMYTLKNPYHDCIEFTAQTADSKVIVRNATDGKDGITPETLIRRTFYDFKSRTSANAEF